MSLKTLLLKVLRVEWLGEVDTTADTLLKAVLQKVLRWSWRLAGVGGIAFLFLVPFSIFALTPQEQNVLNVLKQHQALEDSALIQHQAHERRDAAHNHYSKKVLRQLQQHQQQESQTLLIHQAQERTLPNGAFLSPSELAQQQQKELRRLLLRQQDELREARRAHRSKRYIQLLRRRQHLQLLALQQHFHDEDQASPFAMRDLDDFDSPNFDFFPHPRRHHLDFDGDYDNDHPGQGRRF